MPEPAPDRPSAAPVPQRMSLAARLLNVFAIPGDVFEDVKSTTPSVANWLVPTVILAIVAAVSVWLITSQEPIKQKMREQVWKTVQMQVDKNLIPKDKAEASVEMYLGLARVMQSIGVGIFSFIQPFWWGLVLWFIGARMWRANVSYMKAVEVAGLAGTILILKAVVAALLAVSFSNPTASTSLAMLVKDGDPRNPAVALLGLVNVMDFWVLGVRTVGLSRLAGVPFVRALVPMVGVWLFLSVVRAGLMLAAFSMGGGG